MKFLEPIRSSEPGHRKSLGLFLVAYFMVLFNYPFVRASSTTFFFEAFGAKSSPTAWLWGVIFLVLTVYLSNRLQAKVSVQRLFSVFSSLTAIIFGGSVLAQALGQTSFAYLPFIWKEIYIVVQVHLLLAYANNFLGKSEFKLMVGLIGGAGSIGGILGGLATSYLAENFGTQEVMWTGLVFVVLPVFFFAGTPILVKPVEERAKSPLASFTPGVGKYVAIIAAIVALTQFIINVADFRFHLAFEEGIAGAGARTSYLGNVYMMTNALTFFLQFLVLPFVLVRVSERGYHLFVPFSYLTAFLLLLFLEPAGLAAYAAFFIYLKGADYSLFSAGKEILYQPLTPNQKYGAKYLTDMLVYRLAKAMIAAVLIYLQSSYILNILTVLFLLAWIGLIIRLFRLHRELFP